MTSENWLCQLGKTLGNTTHNRKESLGHKTFFERQQCYPKLLCLLFAYNIFCPFRPRSTIPHIQCWGVFTSFRQFVQLKDISRNICFEWKVAAIFTCRSSTARNRYTPEHHIDISLRRRYVYRLRYLTYTYVRVIHLFLICIIEAFRHVCA